MLSVPEPQPNDPEDLTTALETAAIFSAQGDVREAVRWVRRAAELAGDSGDDMRALTLARAVADLGESMAPKPPAAAAEPAPAPAPASAEAELPPPPPLPGRSVTTSGDRITNPGPGPELVSQPPPLPEEAQAAVPSGPRSNPPPATHDEGWSTSDSEPETPRPTNGAAHEAAPAAPALPVQPAAEAPAAPVLPAAPAEPAVVAAAPAVAAPAPATPSTLSAVRARIEATTEAGVFRVTLLGAGESVGPYGHEAVIVLTDPTAKLG